MLTGRPPFVGLNSDEVVDKLLNSPHEPISRWQQVPFDLARIVNQCLRKNPEQRYSNARVIVDEIERLRHTDHELVVLRKTNNLPALFTTVISHRPETKQLQRLLVKSRFVTLTGAGGYGKTRLAVHVGQGLIDQFPDGVWFVDLSSLGTPQGIWRVVAMALGIDGTAREPGEDVIIDFLESKHAVVILDNCEHLLRDCATLATRLLHRCRHLGIMATSREPLGVTGEVTFRVPSLACADVDETSSEAALLLDAVRLFVDRATAVNSDFVLSDANAVAVCEICHRLDGIPLAIELAAARTNVLSAEDIAHRLGHRFELLRHGNPAALRRHQTLVAVLDWSYDLLNNSERRVFHRMGVFAGSFTMAAARAVCTEELDILELIDGLVSKSLLTAEMRSEETRYRILESVAQYAVSRLAESGDLKSARNRHAEYFLTLAESAEQQIRTIREPEALDQLEREHENIRTGLEWVQHDGMNDDAGLRYCAALWRFWSSRGYIRESQKWIERALQSASSNTVARAKMLTGAGVIASNNSQASTAVECFEQVLDICDRIGSTAPLELLRYQGSLAHLPQGLSLFERGQRLADRLGHRAGVAASLANLGLFAFEHDDGLRGETLLEAAIARYRVNGDDLMVAASLESLGDCLVDQLDLRQGWVKYQESLTILRASQLPYLGLLLPRLCHLAYEQAHLSLARTLVDESLEVNRRFRNYWAVSGDLGALGHLAAEEGDFWEARRFYDDALKIRQRLGTRKLITNILNDIAELLLTEHRYDEARECVRQSLTILRSGEIGPAEQFQLARS